MRRWTSRQRRHLAFELGDRADGDGQVGLGDRRQVGQGGGAQHAIGGGDDVVGPRRRVELASGSGQPGPAGVGGQRVGEAVDQVGVGVGLDAALELDGDGVEAALDDA